MGGRRAIERPPLAKLRTWKFTFSSKTNPFGCQVRGGAEVAAGAGGRAKESALAKCPPLPNTYLRRRSGEEESGKLSSLRQRG